MLIINDVDLVNEKPTMINICRYSSFQNGFFYSAGTAARIQPSPFINLFKILTKLYKAKERFSKVFLRLCVSSFVLIYFHSSIRLN